MLPQATYKVEGLVVTEGTSICGCGRLLGWHVRREGLEFVFPQCLHTMVSVLVLLGGCPITGGAMGLIAAKFKSRH